MGTEHEYSVNDPSFHPLPVVDHILEDINGRLENEFQFGEVNLSKELQKHVIEIVPHQPHLDLLSLERTLYDGLQRFFSRTNGRYKLLGLGMHPLLTLNQTTYWDHEDVDLYRVYDRVFDLKQHGWLNIQALQVNTPYTNEDDLLSKFNKLRCLLPYLAAITASSPFVEGKKTGAMDNRLLFYKENQKRVPLICNGVIPEKLSSLRQHDEILEEIYRQLRALGAEDLCHEWIDSRGLIIRPGRRCLEIKIMDEQECIRSDMGVSAFSLALMRSDVRLEDDQQALYDLTKTAIQAGTSKLRPELRKLYRAAWEAATMEERIFLPIVKERIEKGSLAELFSQKMEISSVLSAAERCLRTNIPYSAD